MEAESVYVLLSAKLRDMLRACEPDFEKLQEIRLRAGQPVLVKYDGAEYVLSERGLQSVQGLCPDRTGNMAGFLPDRRQLQETLECISGYSLYAFDEELRQGFLTVQGGHRIGVAGDVILDRGRVQCIRHISFLNIRVAHQKTGCADTVMPYLYEGGRVCHTLLLSPPGCGKTTMLRDIIRQISDGTETHPGRTVGVVDERYELSGAYLGVPQKNLGMRTDVLGGCPKAEGMRMLLRSMSPAVIAVDELGNERDQEALERVFQCGCSLLATVHAASFDGLSRRPGLNRMLRRRLFDRYLVLTDAPHPGTVLDLFDADGKALPEYERWKAVPGTKRCEKAQTDSCVRQETVSGMEHCRRPVPKSGFWQEAVPGMEYCRQSVSESGVRQEAAL